MSPKRRLRLLFCLVCLLAALAAAGCAPQSNPWLDRSEQETLENKVKVNHNAYLRFQQAEEEARKDGSVSMAERYKIAKDDAYKAYCRSSQEFDQLMGHKRLEAAKEKRKD